MLLPFDPSLLLRSLNELLTLYPAGNFSIVFDSLTELTLTLGLERAYHFIRQMLEMLTKKKTTALFLLKPNAHDPKTVSSFKALFANQIAHTKNGLEPIKLTGS
jgi:hypothetical protein